MEVKSNSITEIVQAIKEASAWCDFRWDGSQPRASLRTLEFSPCFFDSNNFNTVKNVIFSRRYEILRREINPSNNCCLGKILVYEPDSNMTDGMSEGETNGFIDVNDCPPWDTWVGYIAATNNRFVLCWIPNKLVQLVEEGAYVNCAESFYWLEESNEIWAHELKLAIV